MSAIDILIGFAIGGALCIFVILDTERDRNTSVEKRCIEVNAGTYEAGEFKYTDDKIKYIFTGKK